VSKQQGSCHCWTVTVIVCSLDYMWLKEKLIKVISVLILHKHSQVQMSQKKEQFDVFVSHLLVIVLTPLF
jgi:hypothetical protein